MIRVLVINLIVKKNKYGNIYKRKYSQLVSLKEKKKNTEIYIKDLKTATVNSI